MAVIGAAAAVLAHRPAELRHRQHDGVGHAIAQIGDQRGDRAREVVEARRQLPLRRALVDVRVPAANLGERDFESDIRFRELRDLLQRLTERRTRILGAVLGLIPGWIERLQHLDRAECVVSRGIQDAIGGGRIFGLERRADASRARGCSNVELTDLSHRQGRSGAAQRPRQLRR